MIGRLAPLRDRMWLPPGVRREELARRGAGRAKQRGFLLDPYRFGAAPTDPSYASVSLLLHFDGTNGGTTITDNGPHARTPNSVGSVTTVSAQSMFGGSSGLFTTGTHINYLADTTTNLSGDFTLECWFRLNALGVGQAFMAGETGTGFYNYLLYVNASNHLQFECSSSSAVVVNITGTTTLTTGVWHHAAGVRSGNLYTMFLDGVSEGTPVTTSTTLQTAQPLYIGSLGDGVTFTLNGWLDDLRITKGVARYSSNFTPTGPFPNM